MLARVQRVTRKADFDRVFAAGRAVHHPLCTLRAAPNELQLARAGIICGKRIGGAVVRNRTKRRVREALRQRLASVPPGWDILIVVQSAGAEASLGQFVSAFDHLLRRRSLTAQ